MVARLLLILVLVLIVLGWLRSRKVSGTPPGPRSATRGTASASAATQPVLPCAFCGAYLPRADALPGRDGALFYCSEAHRREAGNV